jgi:hypothetical protein
MNMTSSAAKKAWATRRRKRGFSKKAIIKATKEGRVIFPHKSAAGKAHATMKKGKRIRIHSPKIKVNGSAKTTYAAPKRWWDHMTKDPHGSAGKPLSPAAAGHLWFKVYNNDKRLAIIKQYG